MSIVKDIYDLLQEARELAEKYDDKGMIVLAQIVKCHIIK